MKKTNRDYSPTRILFSFILILTLVFLFFTELFAPNEADKKDYFTVLDGDWTIIHADGSRENVGPVSATRKFECEAEATFEIEYTLPNSIPMGSYIVMRSSMQSVNIFVGDDLRSTFDNSETRLWSKTRISGWVSAPLESPDAGKTLLIRSKAAEMYAGSVNEVYMGTQMGIWRMLLRNYGMEMMLEISSIILALAIICVCIILKVKERVSFSLVYIALSLFLSSMYLLTDSPIRQLLFPNISVLTDFSLYFALLAWIPYLLYIDIMQNHRRKKFFNVIITILLDAIIVFAVLLTTSAVDSISALTVGLPMYMIVPLLIIATIIIDIRKGYFKNYKIIGILYLLLMPLQMLKVLYSFLHFSFNPSIIYSIVVIALLVVDLTTEMTDYVEVRSRAHEAELANEAKSSFLANMSHEIRTPINSILGMDEMILRESDNSEVLNYATIIQNSGKFLLGIINDVLDFSKIEAGKMEIIEDDYNTAEMLNSLVDILHERAEKKDLAVNLDISEKIPSVLHGDAVRVKQIVLNILSNATKYTEKGSVSFSVKWTAQESDGLEFIVQDTGIGMKKEELGKLFEKFQRLDHKHNSNVEGTGLGMSIVDYLIHAMNGKIDVDSEFGRGTAITIFIPQKSVSEQPIGNISRPQVKVENKKAYIPQFLAPDANILVVDDVKMNRMVFKALLKKTLIGLDMAASGAECLKMCKSRKYDLIFMDHLMPEMDGIETFNRLRSEENPNQKTPVIILTANAISGAREKYLETGFDDYLSKPVESSKLESFIIQYLPKEKISHIENP